MGIEVHSLCPSFFWHICCVLPADPAPCMLDFHLYPTGVPQETCPFLLNSTHRLVGGFKFQLSAKSDSLILIQQWLRRVLMASCLPSQTF